jgi:4-hydroxybenzoate polyprenyltransferase
MFTKRRQEIDLDTRPILMKRISDYIRLLRPEQWLKNVFVVVPLIFSKNLFNISLFSGSLLTFLSFCFAASSIYVVNDIADRDLDRIHPVKRNRPIAAGAVTATEGWVIAATLMFVSSIMLFLGGVRSAAAIPIILYVLMNLLYSFRLKKIVLIDVFVIAAGFILRIIAGGYAINVRISSWLIMTTLFVSIFLGIAKRRGEFVSVSGNSYTASSQVTPATRKVLEDYDLSLIDQILSVSAASVIIAYALYTVSERTVQAFGTEALIYTTVFVVYGIFRYLYLIHKLGLGENPTSALLTDKPMLIDMILFVASILAVIYKHELIRIVSRYVSIQ